MIRICYLHIPSVTWQEYEGMVVVEMKFKVAGFKDSPAVTDQGIRRDSENKESKTLTQT